MTPDWVIMWQVRWPVIRLFYICLCLFMFVYMCLVTCPFLETVYSSHAEGTYFPQPEYQLQLPRRFFQMPWPSDWGASTQAEPKSGQLRICICALGAQLLQYIPANTRSLDTSHLFSVLVPPAGSICLYLNWSSDPLWTLLQPLALAATPPFLTNSVWLPFLVILTRQPYTHTFGSRTLPGRNGPGTVHKQ